ncbi:MAG: glucose-6-phosphate isomerase, partial [Rhodospirillaceae bacterium]
EVLTTLDPASTLFAVCSKTFTTTEMMANAHRARDWIVENLGEQAVSKHMIAVSADTEKATSFGIPEDSVFPIWDWVGGRFSLWSAMSVSAIIACGYEVFDQFLAGAEAMDRHFETASLGQNLPVILAMIGVWHSDFLGASAHAVLAYDHALRLLPAHIQQLDMESNGKGVSVDGTPLDVNAGSVVFGGSGSDSQHSFFQLLHQSPRLISSDFIAALSGGDQINRDLLLSNVFGQTEALMMGRAPSDLDSVPEHLRAHRAFPGNRPTTTLLLDDLSPYAVGMLVALYEHKIFVQSLVWGINAFDQWGVELGKKAARSLEAALAGEPDAVKALEDGNSSTAGLVAAYLAVKQAAP